MFQHASQAVSVLHCTDSEDLPLRHQSDGAEMSWVRSVLGPKCLDTVGVNMARTRIYSKSSESVQCTGAEMSRGHFGTGTELSRPPANILLLQ